MHSMSAAATTSVRKSDDLFMKAHSTIAHRWKDFRSALEDAEEEEWNDAFTQPRGRLSAGWTKPKIVIEYQSKWGHSVISVVDSISMQFFLSIVIVLNAVLVVVQTDAKARNQPHEQWVQVASSVMLLLFVLDICARLYAHRLTFFCSVLNTAEFCVVTSDAVLEVFAWLQQGEQLSFGYLRLMRLARFFRIFRLLSGFRELFMMLHGMQSAMKAMLWSLLMVAIVIMLWSIFAVEFIRELAHELNDRSVFPSSCQRCPHVFDSVWKSALTLFSTIISGDSWGVVAIPLMEEYWYTSFFFFGSFFMINLGLMNLMVAVIVDRAAEARREDEEHILHEKTKAFKFARLRLYRLCKKLDTNHDGILSKEELTQGVLDEPEFADILKLMDVTAEDLDQVFSFLDRDRSGEITYKEFIGQIHRLKTVDPHTVLILLGQQVANLHEKIDTHVGTPPKPSNTVGCGRRSTFSTDSMRFPEHDVEAESARLSLTSVCKSQSRLSDIGTISHAVVEQSSRVENLSEPKDSDGSTKVTSATSSHCELRSASQKCRELQSDMRKELETLQQKIDSHITSIMDIMPEQKADTRRASFEPDRRMTPITENMMGCNEEKAKASHHSVETVLPDEDSFKSAISSDHNHHAMQDVRDASCAIERARRAFPAWPRITL